ncbi:MAG: Hsp20/alpha crystallin family protein [Nanoarchaeota archaeon]|jgi:HSP20 family protein|nr:Hsp20/alpha crystallin family protein [Nanoarchaeota archaeon]
MIREEIDRIFIEFDLSGFKRDDINVDIQEDYVSISAKTESEERSEKEGFRSFEKSSKSFSYSSSLPLIEKEESEVDFIGGKLRIVLLKK